MAPTTEFLIWLDLNRLGWLICLVALLCCDGVAIAFAITPYLVAPFFFFFFLSPPFSYASFSVLFQSHATDPKRHRHLGLTEVYMTTVSIAGIFHSTKVSQHAVPVNTVLGG